MTVSDRVAANHAREVAERVAADRAREVAHAQRWLEDLIAQTDDGYESDDGKLGDGSGTYAETANKAESYMVGGGGPSGWIWFVFREPDDDDDEEVIDHAYLEYVSASGRTLVPVPTLDEYKLLAACRADAAERNCHG